MPELFLTFVLPFDSKRSGPATIIVWLNTFVPRPSLISSTCLEKCAPPHRNSSMTPPRNLMVSRVLARAVRDEVSCTFERLCLFKSCQDVIQSPEKTGLCVCESLCNLRGSLVLFPGQLCLRRGARLLPNTSARWSPAPGDSQTATRTATRQQQGWTTRRRVSQQVR